MATKTVDYNKAKRALDKLRAERNSLADLVAETEAERDARVPKADHDKVLGQLRGDRHKTAFRTAALEAKVRPEAIDDLWELSKLDTSSDTPDPAKIADSIKGAVAKRPYLLGDDSTEGDGKVKAPKEKLPAGEGLSRLPQDKEIAGFTISEENARDPAFMALNQSKIAEHSAAGTLRFV